MILMAQAVPSATRLPCLATLPSGWSAALPAMQNGRATLWLDSDRGGRHAVGVTLTRACTLQGAVRVPSDEVGTTRYEKPLTLRPTLTGYRYYVFPGGCVRYRYRFTSGAPSSLLFDMDAALATEPRADVAARVAVQDDALLCGVGVHCEG